MKLVDKYKKWIYIDFLDFDKLPRNYIFNLVDCYTALARTWNVILQFERKQLDFDEALELDRKRQLFLSRLFATVQPIDLYARAMDVKRMQGIVSASEVF